ncbi:hypothetical protein J3E69DRAFT_319655 [Trichoderma sp. SZMC 28015]
MMQYKLRPFIQHHIDVVLVLLLFFADMFSQYSYMLMYDSTLAMLLVALFFPVFVS